MAWASDSHLLKDTAGGLRLLGLCRDPRAWVTARVWPGHSTVSTHEDTEMRRRKESGDLTKRTGVEAKDIDDINERIFC